MTASPIDLLAVASWYPSRLDPIAGRFVADQLEALAATGRVRPAVVSFEPAELIGAGALRSRIAAMIDELSGAAVRGAGSVFAVPTAGAAPGLPTARLTIPSGRNPAAGALHGAIARDGALGALADRFAAGAERDVPRPAIVHGHTVYPDGAGAAGLATRLGARLVVTEHASFVARLIAEPTVRARYEATIAAADRLVVVSRTLAAELVAALPAIEPKVTVIPNAIPIKAFAPAISAPRVADELLFVGYRKASKGIETLLRAFATVHAERPAAVLRLVGSSPSEEIERAWHGLAADLGIGGSVRFDPPADRAGVAAALARASLFVHPSPRETFGVVAVEALAAGLPVVAADSGGVTEILGPNPEALGAIVPPDDPEALSAAILGALGRIGAFDPARLSAHVAGRYDEATVAARLVELYEAVLEQATPAARAGARVAGGIAAGAGAAGAIVAGAGAAGDAGGRTGAPTVDPRAAGSPRARRVVVALDPARTEAVERLDPTISAGLVLVTSAGPDWPGLDRLGGIVRTDLHGRARALSDAAILGPPRTGIRRVLRAIRHPLAVARRRGWLPGLEQLVERRGGAAVREAVTLAAGPGLQGPGGPIEVVCIDGLDHLAAAPVIRSGQARLAVGALRRLGDEGDVGDPRSGLSSQDRVGDPVADDPPVEPLLG